MSTWYMISFQDSNSPYADNLMTFHNFTFMMLLMIITVTLYMLLHIITNSFINRFMLKHHTIEIIWTIIPMMILMFICVPSLKTLYLIDELWNPCYFTVKSVGHQWYWSYEYPEFNNFEFDSFMLISNPFKTPDPKYPIIRLLDVDNRLIMPYGYPLRTLTTSVDVIHSWTVPCLGLKMDATPGRINQGNLYTTRPGIYYGQCSEICGANHSFMPIAVESSSFKTFMMWVMSSMQF